MLKSFSIILICLICCSNLEAQKEWSKIDTYKRSAERNFQHVIQIINEETKELVSFFQYPNFFVANLQNKDGELLNSFSAAVLPKYRRNYIGTSINGDDYTLYFKNDYGSKFSSLTFNFKTSGFKYADQLDFKLKAETLIATFEYKSHIYLLTSVKRSSILKLYKLEGQENFSVNLISFENIKFTTPRGFDVHLNYLLDGGYDSAKAPLIRNDEPSSLELSSQKNKLFLNGDKIYLLNDVNDLSTTVLSIDLTNFEPNHYNFKKESFDKKERGSKSNSFLLEDKFYNLYVTKEELDFNIYDLESKKLIKSIKVSEKDSISFKNSPIILEGGDFENYRELDRTKQFFRKVSNSNAAISVYKKNDKYIITLGSSESSAKPAIAFIGGFTGGLAFAVTSALLTPSFYSYTTTKSTRIECLFDKDFNSLSGKIPQNGFDKIDSYISENSAINFKHKAVFKFNENYILGYFDKKSGFYHYILF